ncbi:MAG: hypothetical protein II797_05160 [Clostridia bacterium]|nr:hypothetical protein [Clostridia bacterium]
MSDTKKATFKSVINIVLIVLASIIVLYGIAYLFLGQVMHGTFYAKSEFVMDIPDLSSGFTPQGVTTDEGSGKVFVCGYLSGGKASRIYVLDPENKTSVKIELSYEDGSVYSGHAGGITCAGEYTYISNASKIFILRTEDLLGAQNGDTVAFIDRFAVPCNSSFCSSSDGFLYVGEFYSDGYETAEDHQMITQDGSKHGALVFGYELDESAPGGVLSQNGPVVSYSVCDEVQGFAILNGQTACLSVSRGLSFSRLKQYDVTGDADDTFEFEDGTSIPLYYLDGDRLTDVYTMPHMSEDLDVTEGRLIIAFEGCAKKYGGNLLPDSLGSVFYLGEKTK